MKTEKPTNNKPDRVLYYEAAYSAENLNLNLNHYRDLIEKALQAWDEICSTKLTLVEIQKILNAEKKADFITDLFCDKLLEGQKVEIMNFPVNKENLKSLIALPDIFDFLKSINNFSRQPEYKSFFSKTEGIQFHLYAIENGKITIDTEAMELQIDRDWREYATQPHELKNLSEVLPLCDALNKLIQQNPKVNQNMIDLDSLLFLNYNGLYVPSSNFIKTGQCVGHVQILTPSAKASTGPNFIAANFSDIPTPVRPTPRELTPEEESKAAEAAEKAAKETAEATEGIQKWAKHQRAYNR